MPMLNKLHLYLLYLTLFFLQAYLIRFNIGPYPSNLQEVFIILLSFTFLFSKPKKILNLKKNWIILSILALSIISSLVVQIFNTLELIRYWKFIIFGSALAFIFFETLTSNKDREKGLLIMTFGAITFGLFSVIYNITGHNVTFDYRLIGPMNSAVSLAYYIAPVLIFSFIKYINTFNKNKITNKYFYTTLTLIVLLIATKSMGSIGGVFLVFLIFLFKKFGKSLVNSKFKKTVLILSLIIVSTIIFYSKILPTLNTTYSSLDERGEIWTTSQYLLKDKQNFLLGIGLGQYQYHYEKTVVKAINNNPLNFQVPSPHNTLLLFWFNYGLIGFVFIIYILYLTVIKLIRKKEFDIQTISLLILLYFFIHGIIDSPFFKNDMFFLLILFLELSFYSTNKISKNSTGIIIPNEN